MTPAELREEIDIELDLIQATLDELSALYHDTKNRQPTVRVASLLGCDKHLSA